MIVIRQEQMQAFKQSLQQDFENNMLAHVEDCFPQKSRAIGQVEVLRLIRAGIERAEHYGLVEQPDVAQFIDVLFTLGPSFDTNPLFPWVNRILNSPDCPANRIRHLVAAVRKHLRRRQRLQS